MLSESVLIMSSYNPCPHTSTSSNLSEFATIGSISRTKCGHRAPKTDPNEGSGVPARSWCIPIMVGESWGSNSACLARISTTGGVSSRRLMVNVLAYTAVGRIPLRVSWNAAIVVGATVIIATGAHVLTLESHVCPASISDDAHTKKQAKVLPVGLLITDCDRFSSEGRPSAVC